MSGLLRSNLVVAAGTALSRVTGLLRVFVFAYVIGQTALADAYALANETPNIVYDLLLGGVLSATLVPLFTSFLGDDGRDADAHATNVVITIAATLMAALTIVAVIAAPLVFRLYSIEVADAVDVETYRRVGTTLTRVFLVQILFYGLTGLANAYLNSRRRFLAAAWSPIAPNLVIIVTLLSLPGAGDTAWTLDDVLTNDRLRWTLGLGATLGVASMAVIVVPAMIGAGLRFRPAWEWKHPAVRKLLALSGWTIGFVIANQIALARRAQSRRGPGTRHREGVLRRVRLVRAAARAARRVHRDDVPAGARASGEPSRPRVVRRPRIARHATDRAAHGARRSGDVRAPRADHRVDATRAVRRHRRLQHVAGAGRSVDRADRLLGLPLHAAGLLRPPGHSHRVRAQRRREPAQHRLRDRAVWAAGASSGSGSRTRSAYLLSSVWALRVLSYKVRGFDLRTIWRSVWRMLFAGVLMAEAIWFVTRGVAVDTGWNALAQIVVGGSVGVVVYVAVLVALDAPELDWMRRRLAR